MIDISFVKWKIRAQPQCLIFYGLGRNIYRDIKVSTNPSDFAQILEFHSILFHNFERFSLLIHHHIRNHIFFKIFRDQRFQWHVKFEPELHYNFLYPLQAASQRNHLIFAQLSLRTCNSLGCCWFRQLKPWPPTSALGSAGTPYTTKRSLRTMSSIMMVEILLPDFLSGLVSRPWQVSVILSAAQWKKPDQMWFSQGVTKNQIKQK